MILRRIFFITTQTSIRLQDQVFQLVASWPHTDIVNVSQLLKADCKLLRQLLMKHFDAEIVTDTLYQVVFTLPGKNDRLRHCHWCMPDAGG